VSSDTELLMLARELGVLTVDEEYPRGLNGAVTVGTDFCLRHGARALLVLLADLPLVTREDVDLLFHHAERGPQVILVPCKEGEGTNAILRVPPLTIPTRFGGPSLVAHQMVARQQEVPCHVVDVPRIAFDLDSVDDLHWLATHAGSTHLAQVLRELGIGEEMRAKGKPAVR
jgi:2-phospho-L-lactate guanylyltransferase